MLRAKIRSLIKSIGRRTRLEQEMTDEMQFHMDARAKDLVSKYGLSAEEALRRARVEFGSVDKYKDEGRQSRGLRLVDEFRADLRYALRNFRRSPAFTLAVIATLALGIGANTTVFSAVDAALLKKLPVKSPDELVAFDWIRTPRSMFAGYDGSSRPDTVSGQEIRTSFSYPIFKRLSQDNNGTLSDVFAFASIGGLNVVADGQA